MKEDSVVSIEEPTTNKDVLTEVLREGAQKLLADAVARCVECHTKHTAVERTFVQFYPNAPGLSAKSISRLKEQWVQDYDRWRKRDLSQKRYVYVWADGVYCNVRFDDARL